MFVIRIWNYLRGYAIIIVEGLKIERFLNLCLVNGIYIWDVKKVNYTTIKAKIGLENFNKLRDVARKTDSSVEILQKNGLPFVIKNIKRRKFLYIGILLVTIFIYVLSSYVWMIEIVGTKNVSPDKITKNLNELGLREGIKKSSINNRSIENKMLIRMPELAWMGVQIKGTKVFVEVVEKKEAPPLISSKDACDIVAAKDGVIKKLLALNGDAMVKDGATVKKGQVLVSGTIKREGMDVRYVHSMAEITARTWYEDAEEIALQQVEYQKTGNSTTHYRLKVLGKELSKKKLPPYAEYNEYIEEKNILSFGDYVFPVKLIVNKYSELQSQTKNITVQEAKQQCAERLDARIKLQIPEDAVVVNRKIDYYVDKKTVKAKISVEVLEDIGVKQKINN